MGLLKAFNQTLFLDPCPTFHLAFPFSRLGNSNARFAVYQRYGSASGSVFCTGALIVRTEAMVDVVGDAGVIGIVTASDDVENPKRVQD